MGATWNEEKQFKDKFGPDLDGVIDWVQAIKEPEDVFSVDQLRTWALHNNMVDKED